MGLGFTIAAAVWWLPVLFCILYLGIYLPVMRVESVELTGIFGDSYSNYAAQVPLFIPRLTKFKDGENPAGPFEMELYLKYREYRAAIGLTVAFAILILKMYLLN